MASGSITITLEYQDNIMRLPVNPENMTVRRSSPGKTPTLLGVGEVNILQINSLATIEISSFFPSPGAGRLGLNGEFQYTTAKEYADWFKTWQRLKQPARWTVEELGYDLWVTCERFDYDVRAGEEDNTYYELSIKEFRAYGAKLIQAESPVVAVEEPRVDTSPPVQQTYTVVSGDCLWNIAKRLSGDGANWTALYEENKAVIGNNPNLIYPGQVYVVPTAWVT